MASEAKPLRVLCLHGAGLSSEIFKMQLASYVAPLEDSNITLHFLDGRIPTDPHPTLPRGWSDPTFRWFHWAPSPKPFAMADVHASAAYIRAHAEKEGPFDGVLGFSQGSAEAVALLLGAGQDSSATEANTPFKFAILFNSPCLPSFDAAEGKAIAPAWGRISTPSLHVAGEADEWFEGSEATYEDFCEEGSASMVVHPGAHAIPRDAETVKRVLGEIEALVTRAGCR